MTLGLLFTRGISLKVWEKTGLLQRELGLYIALSEKVEKILFFTYGTKEELRYKDILPSNIEVICRPKFIPSALYVFLMPFIQAKYFKKVDIIKTNQMDGSTAGVIARMAFGKKLIIRCGYEWLDFVIRANSSKLKTAIAFWVEKIAYANCDKIIITSDADKEFIIKNFKIKPEKIFVIANYIDVNKFKPSDTLREQSRIIYVGRLEEQKKVANLIEAMSGLEAVLYLVGGGSYKEDLKLLAEQKRVRVEFLGNMSQGRVVEELNKSEIFVLPSSHEGNPKSLLEAMSTALPCIGSDVKGIRGVIIDGESGLLAPLSAEGLREKLGLLLENKDLRDKLGTGARAQIVKNQSLERTIERELEVYNGLLK